MRKGISLYLKVDQARGDRGGEDDKTKSLLNNENHKTYFWKEQPEFNLQLVQIIVLYVVYYLTIYLLCFIHEARSEGLAGAFYAILALLPPVLFGIECPSVLQMHTILASTGNLLDKEILDSISNKDKQGREKLVSDAKSDTNRLNKTDQWISSSEDSDDDDLGLPLSKHLAPVRVKQFKATTAAQLQPILPDISTLTAPKSDNAQLSFADMMKARAMKKQHELKNTEANSNSDEMTPA